ncbi:unnamed protein product [Symbiodinium pilosum]|uniref:Uncharacterized protein n=1 Tax=Symbiodinium pilosum TaxID=2952 RepID=A0A812RLQ7_SYMPI|nr:unnamed protein product [Symbiodinium pilosum]
MRCRSPLTAWREILLRQLSRYAWLKWLSAKRYLQQVDWLVVVDPDMFPTPGCGMELPVVEMYKNICSFAAECSVISNDMWPRDWVAESEKRKVAGYVAGGQDKNAGFTMIRNDELGRLFLELVLAGLRVQFKDRRLNGNNVSIAARTGGGGLASECLTRCARVLGQAT